MKTLRTDNTLINGKKPCIYASVITIELYAKQVLNWRTEKRYNSIFHRFMNTGSTNYDKVICRLYDDGYGIN